MRAHDHHPHPHRDARAGDRRRLVIALAVTLTICLVEIVGGYLSGSLALISDAGHMLSDVLGEVLALLALLWADRPPDDRRTFGYHRIEILMALFQGALLFAMASFVIWQGVLRLKAPPEVHTGIMFGVALVGLVANLLGVMLLRGGHSIAVRGAYLHVLLDTLSSVAVVLTGALMWLTRGLAILDPILSIGIGVFIYYSAFRLARDAVDVLLEAVPRGLDTEQLLRDLKSIEGVRQVHRLHVWSLSSGLHALSVHLVVESDSVSRNRALMRKVNDLLTTKYQISHSTLQIESECCE